jgi:hypothetical protein
MRNSICLSFGARRLDRWLTAVVVVLLAAAVPLSLSAQANPELLVSGLSGTGGSALGPSGDLYVTDGINGTVSRIDPDTGVVTLFASGLPRRAIPVLGGATDIAFLGNMAFALVTVVNQEFGGPDVAGIYRLDGINASTLIADIGTFSRDHVPTGFPVDLETGVQFAIETYRGGFLVTDGHHNRVLRVTLDGEVTELMRPRGIRFTWRKRVRPRTRLRTGRSSCSNRTPHQVLRPRSPPAAP